MGLTVAFHVVFPDIPHIQTGCGKYSGILCGILSVPQNIVMDLNNMMDGKRSPINVYNGMNIVDVFSGRNLICSLQLVVHIVTIQGAVKGEICLH